MPTGWFWIVLDVCSKAHFEVYRPTLRTLSRLKHTIKQAYLRYFKYPYVGVLKGFEIFELPYRVPAGFKDEPEGGGGRRPLSLPLGTLPFFQTRLPGDTHNRGL